MAHCHSTIKTKQFTQKCSILRVFTDFSILTFNNFPCHKCLYLYIFLLDYKVPESMWILSCFSLAYNTLLQSPHTVTRPSHIFQHSGTSLIYIPTTPILYFLSTLCYFLLSLIYMIILLLLFLMCMIERSSVFKIQPHF